MDGRTHGVLRRAPLCCHCLLIETNQGLVLVDTGFGTRDVTHPRERLSPFFRALLAPDLRQSMTALSQVQALGWSAHDVRHIVLTHLDFDHAGGLDDFPDAAVHVLAAEADTAGNRGRWLQRQRFRPQQCRASNAGTCTGKPLAKHGSGCPSCDPCRGCHRTS